MRGFIQPNIGTLGNRMPLLLYHLSYLFTIALSFLLPAKLVGWMQCLIMLIWTKTLNGIINTAPLHVSLWAITTLYQKLFIKSTRYHHISLTYFHQGVHWGSKTVGKETTKSIYLTGFRQDKFQDKFQGAAWKCKTSHSEKKMIFFTSVFKSANASGWL